MFAVDTDEVVWTFFSHFFLPLSWRRSDKTKIQFKIVMKLKTSKQSTI